MTTSLYVIISYFWLSICECHINWTIPYNFSWSLAEMSYAQINDIVYIFGGFHDGNARQDIWMWDLTENDFQLLPISNKPAAFTCSSQCAVLINNTLIYIVEANGIHIFNVSSKSFINLNNNYISGAIYPLSKDTSPSATVSCTVTNNTHLFIIGWLNTIQIYDIINNRWSIGVNSTYNFDQSSCIYYKYTHKIYVFGGWSSQSGKDRYGYSFIYEYSIDYNSWFNVASMEYGKFQSQAIIANDNRIYISGGCCYRKQQGTPSNIPYFHVEVFDPIYGNIRNQLISELNINRYSHIVTLNNVTKKIMVFGGHGINNDGHYNVLNSTEISTQIFNRTNNNGNHHINNALTIYIGIALGISFLLICIIGIIIWHNYKNRKRKRKRVALLQKYSVNTIVTNYSEGIPKEGTNLIY